MKTNYEKPSVELIEFEAQDVLTASGTNNNNSTQQRKSNNEDIKIANMKK